MHLRRIFAFTAVCICNFTPSFAIGFDSLTGFAVNGRADIIQSGRHDDHPGKIQRFMRAEAVPSVDFATSLLQSAASSSLESGLSAWLSMSHLQLHNSSNSAKHDYAVATHICSDDWAPGAIALAASLKQFPMNVDLVVMLSSNVSLPVRSVLSSMFHSVYVEEPITPHPAIQRKGGDCVTLQLRSWQLPYKKVLYMDADMIALSSPEPLFATYGELSAQKDDKGRQKDEFNGGMFMCEPKAATFDLLLKNVRTFHKRKWMRSGIQPFMNVAFPKCNTSQSQQLGKLGRPYHHAGCWRDTFSRTHNRFSRELSKTELDRILAGEAHVYDSIHFSGDWDISAKPWQLGCLAVKDSTTRNNSLQMDVLRLWFRAFSSAEIPASMKHVAEETLQCPAFNCAEAKTHLDYVLFVEKFDCITNATINSLYQYASPRQVLLIAPGSACAEHKTQVERGIMDGRTRCFNEDDVLIGVSRGLVESWLERRHGRARFKRHSAESDYNSTQMTSSLLHTILKLGLAETTSLGLGDDYVVWDSGTLLLRDFCPFNRHGQVNIMEEDEDLDTFCAERHKASLSELTGLAYQYSRKRQRPFSSNHLVINKQSMLKFLEFIRANRTAMNGLRWPEAILEKTCQTKFDCPCGFPAHAAYVSWLMRTSPQSMVEAPKQYVVASDREPVKQHGKTKMVERTPCCPIEHKNDDKSDGHLAVRFDRSAACRGPPPPLKEERVKERRKEKRTSPPRIAH